MQPTFISDRVIPSGALPSRESRLTPPWLEIIRQSVDAVDFGTVQIKVHGGEVVQIETTRKIRIPSPVTHFHPTAPAEEEQPIR